MLCESRRRGVRCRQGPYPACDDLTRDDWMSGTNNKLHGQIGLVRRRTDSDLALLRIIEGIAANGTHLAAMAARAGYQVVESARMDAHTHRGTASPNPWTPAGLPRRSCPLNLSGCVVRRKRRQGSGCAADPGQRPPARDDRMHRDHQRTVRVSARGRPGLRCT